MGLGRGTERLAREIEGALPHRPFTIRFWDGNEVAANEGADGPVFTVRSPRAVAQVLRAPGQLGLGRAYVSGEIDVDDLDGVIDLLNSWQPPKLSPTERLALMLSAGRAIGLVRPPRRPAAELRPSGRRHSRERDARAVRHHYDVPGDFFALFLGEQMAYSCGFFSRVGGPALQPGQADRKSASGENGIAGPDGCQLITDPLDGPDPIDSPTLEQAQWAKLELTARKLRLQPGMRLLDVGCGWGSFVIHAAKHHGVRALGITLSEPQAQAARRRAEAAGVEDRVDVRVADYRDPELGGAIRSTAVGRDRFDAIASIGMVEHVGAVQIDEYARQMAELLRPGGCLLNHGIARLRHTDPAAGAFSERYVFPDGEPLQLSRILLALERAGFITRGVEEFGADYAETLSHWIERLESDLPRALELAGPERVRVWRLYLRAARNGFRIDFTSIYQTLCQLPG